MTLGLVGALLGSCVGAFASPFVAQEVRSPRLLTPFPDAELPGKCRTCHALLRPARIGFYANWEALRGRCPKCHHPIPVWAAWSEVAVLVVGFLVGWRTPTLSWLAPYLLLAFVTVVVVVVDARLHLISTKLVYSAVAAALALFLLIGLATDQPDRIKWMLICGLGASGFIWILWLISPGGMGQGDARLGLLLGLYLGWLGWRAAMLGIFLGFTFGATGGLVLLAFRKAGRKTQIAFGPYLAVGALIVLLFPSITSHFAN